MMFEEVLPALREGKKVRRRGWSEGGYIQTNSVMDIVNEFSDPASGLYNNMLIDDWEVVEEPAKPTINLTEYDVGKRVRLRSGLVALITSYDNTEPVYKVRTGRCTYFADGRYHTDQHSHELDIVEVLDA